MRWIVSCGEGRPRRVLVCKGLYSALQAVLSGGGNLSGEAELVTVGRCDGQCSRG